MAAIPVDLQPRRAEDDQVEFVEDLDEILEANRCSCNAGDDNPY
jgi:hypothetical protein